MRARLQLRHMLGCTLLMLSAQAAFAEAVPLQALLASMPDSPAITASLHDQQRVGAELQQRQAASSWSLFGSVGTGRYRDIEQSGMEEYDGYGAQLGLRHPLLGALQARRLAVADAELALGQAHYSTALTRAEQRLQLRQIYIEWWRAQVLEDWCFSHQEIASAEQQAVADRISKQQLRMSEQLWVEQRWRTLLRPCRNLSQHTHSLRQQLQQLSGSPLPTNARAQSEPLPFQLAPLEQWLPALEQHPALQTHQVAEQSLQSFTDSHWTDRVDAYFSIAQRYDHRADMSGSGGGFYAGITFETPLSGLFSSEQPQPMRSRHLAAQHQTQDARNTLRQALDQSLLQYQQLLANLHERKQQQTYAQQLLLEQTARQRIDTEVGFMNLRLAHAEKADIELGWIEDWHAAWTLLAQLHTLAEEEQPVYPTQTLRWDSGLEQNEGQKPSALTTVLHQDSAWSTAAYVWDSRPLLDQQSRSKQINALAAAGFNHLYLGFDATQVAALAQLSPQIEQLISQLRQRGFTIDLLLGDPAWLLPMQRQELLQLIDRFSHLPFDHLHLDLEVEQLGWPVPEPRLQEWLKTLEASAQHSPWPVTMVSHHRWFAATERTSSRCIPCTLPELGIRGVTLMLYSTAEQSVIERSKAILEAWPALQITLAQSAEAGLPPENSWHGSTATELRVLTARLHDELAPWKLTGVAWQDWAQYPKSGTEKITP